jgi:hypothetical protein
MGFRELEAPTSFKLDLDRVLGPRQRTVHKSRERIIRLLCGRQSGKTYWACVWLLEGGLKTPRSLSVYLALTQTSARNIAWDELVRLGTTVFGLPDGCFREHTLTVHLPNGSRIIVKGTDDRRTIESWRGTKIYRAVIDEMGSQMPDLIEYFVESIIWPALVRMNGRLALLGTPGLVADGYWYEQTRPEVLEQDPGGFRWMIYENPGIPHAGEFLRETLGRFKYLGPLERLDQLGASVVVMWADGFWARVGDSSRFVSLLDGTERVLTSERVQVVAPQFCREWLASWVVDLGAIVYPYDPARNGIDHLPERSETGIIIPPNAWRYVIGNDVGVIDLCAWMVWAWTPAWRGMVGVYSHQDQYDPDPAAVKGQQLHGEYKRLGQTDYVLDTGGLGKAHEAIYRQKYSIPCIAAEKVEKPSAIRELRADLLTGTAKLLNGPECNPIRGQWAALGWCPKKLHHNPDQPDHLADAGLYGHRRVRHYTHQPDAHRQPAPMGSAERRLHDYEAMMEQRARKMSRRRGRLER